MTIQELPQEIINYNLDLNQLQLVNDSVIKYVDCINRITDNNSSVGYAEFYKQFEKGEVKSIISDTETTNLFINTIWVALNVFDESLNIWIP